MPRIIIMHDNGTEEIQDFCAECFPTVDAVENHCRECGGVQWVQHNAVHADYAGEHYHCDNEECRKVLDFEDISAEPFTAIIPINGRLNYAAG